MTRARDIAFAIFMVGMGIVSTALVVTMGDWAMPTARASHEPGLASRPGHSVTVAIAGGR